MLPRLKTTIAVCVILLGFMNVVAPVLVDPVDGVVGTGTAVSCTSAAGLDDLQDEINDGGLVTFNCGAAPVIIPVTTTLEADADIGSINATLDGGGLITAFRRGKATTFKSWMKAHVSGIRCMSAPYLLSL